MSLTTVYFGDNVFTNAGNWNTVSCWFSSQGSNGGSSSPAVPGVPLGRLPDPTTDHVLVLGPTTMTVGPSTPYSGMVTNLERVPSGTFSGLCRANGSINPSIVFTGKLLVGTDLTMSWGMLASSADGGATASIGVIPKYAINTQSQGWITPTGKIFISCNPYISISSDGGKTWKDKYVDLFAGYAFNNVSTYSGTKLTVSDDGNTIVVYSSSSSFGLAISTDGGNTFVNRVPDNTYGMAPYHVAMSRSGRYIYVMGRAGGAGGSFYIRVSSDYGVTWTASSTSFTYNNSQGLISVSDDGSTAIYVANGTALRTIWKSVNYGVTWTAVNVPSTNKTFNSCAVSGNGNVMYCTENTNTWKSINSGTSWSLIGAGGSRSITGNICSYDGSTFVSGVTKTTDGGATFSPVTLADKYQILFNSNNLLTAVSSDLSKYLYYIQVGSPTPSNLRVSGDFRGKDITVISGVITGGYYDDSLVKGPSVSVMGGTYSPAATVTVSKTGITGIPDDLGFKTGGTFAPVLTLRGPAVDIMGGGGL